MENSTSPKRVKTIDSTDVPFCESQFAFPHHVQEHVNFSAIIMLKINLRSSDTWVTHFKDVCSEEGILVAQLGFKETLIKECKYRPKLADSHSTEMSSNVSVKEHLHRTKNDLLQNVSNNIWLNILCNITYYQKILYCRFS